MSIEVRVPQLPESVADATLVAWHKQPGESISRDENLVDLETDKVVLEVPSPMAGILKEIKIANGTTVTSGQLLAILEEGPAQAAGGAPGSTRGAVATPAAPSSAQANGAATKAAGSPSAAGPTASANGSVTAAKSVPGASQKKDKEAAESKGAEKVAPAARRLAEELHLDTRHISGSGPDGLVTKGDVIQHVGQGDRDGAPGAVRQVQSSTTATPSSSKTTSPVAQAPSAIVVRGASKRSEERVPMTRLRARIAERLVQAQATAAMLTTFNEVDMTAINEVRARYKDKFEKVHGVKLGFMSFFVKATTEALRRFPAVNAAIDGNDTVYHHYYDIGVAVSTDRGLMVPVLRDADSKSFAEIEASIGAFAQRAKDGAITIDELTGGTFTITNGGVFGSLMSTPILNMPQVAILGMHKIQERPIAVNGQVVVRPMMYLALTYDHRIVDGRESVQFLVAIKEALEDPARLLLQL